MYVQRFTAGLHLYPYGRNIIINGIEFTIIKLPRFDNNRSISLPFNSHQYTPKIECKLYSHTKQFDMMINKA